MLERSVRERHVFLFVIYALIVWYAAARWRRRWASFASVALGLLGLVLVGWFHVLLDRWSGHTIYLPVLQSLLYPYAALVTAVGGFIACLPRHPAPGACASCRYDLSGLAGADAGVCPECGTPADGPGRTVTEPAPVVPVPASRPGPDSSASVRRRRSVAQDVGI